MAEKLSALHTGYKFLQFYSLVYVIKTYCFDITQCIGPSMLPTMNESGDIVLVDKTRKPFKSEFKKGMVILAKSPTEPTKTVCKRIKAVEGDKISIKWTPYYQTFRLLFEKPRKFSNKDYAEMSPFSLLSEEEIDKLETSEYPQIVEFKKRIDEYSNKLRVNREASKAFKVPKGYVWIEGDNPSNSTDSRHFGPIPLNLITGVVVCKLWPLNDFGFLSQKPK